MPESDGSDGFTCPDSGETHPPKEVDTETIIGHWWVRCRCCDRLHQVEAAYGRARDHKRGNI